MPTTQSKSAEELFAAAEKLSLAELDAFTDRVTRLRVQRRHPNPPEREAELLLKINEGLPDTIWQRYHVLVDLRKDGTLSRKEYAELSELTNQIEIAHARRMEYLAELSHLQGKGLEE